MKLVTIWDRGDFVPDIDINSICTDSRKIQPGDLFVAIPGARVDGRQFIADAEARGAAAIMTSSEAPVAASVPVIQVANVRAAYAAMASRLFPQIPEALAAVTGTNGKTSVAEFVRQIWSAAGLSAASIGTLGVRADTSLADGNMTTPDPMVLHQWLSDLAGKGVTHAVMEASSHGLHQNRMDAVPVKAAGFTNLTRDHLDYHGTERAYLLAKARLFGDVLRPGGVAVIDRTSGAPADLMADIAWARGLEVRSIGPSSSDFVYIRDVRPVGTGLSLDVDIGGERRALDLPLMGAFQAHNALMALMLAEACGTDLDAGLAAFQTLATVPGRMDQAATLPGDIPVVIDYAHTPDALATALDVMRPHIRGDVHVVFGCGGDRDTGKRSQMGAIAAAKADKVIVTDDNPRSEDPQTVRDMILAACPGALDIGDRTSAILAAMDAAKPGDGILIAGKGHETGQIGADGVVMPYSDFDVVRSAVGADHAGDT